MFERAIIRLKVNLHGPRLLADLAGGVSPTSSAEHWLRASTLVTRDHRRTLAGGLERLLADAELGPQITAAIPPRREAVRDAREELISLVVALRGSEPVHPHGAALVERLLTAPDSPAFAAAPAGTLAVEAARALDALAPEPAGVVEPSVPRAT